MPGIPLQLRKGKKRDLGEYMHSDYRDMPRQFVRKRISINLHQHTGDLKPQYQAPRKKRNDSNELILPTVGRSKQSLNRATNESQSSDKYSQPLKAKQNSISMLNQSASDLTESQERVLIH